MSDNEVCELLNVENRNLSISLPLKYLLVLTLNPFSLPKREFSIRFSKTKKEPT